MHGHPGLGGDGVPVGQPGWVEDLDAGAAHEVGVGPVLAAVEAVGREVIQGAVVAAVVVGVEQDDLGEAPGGRWGQCPGVQVGVGDQQDVGGQLEAVPEPGCGLAAGQLVAGVGEPLGADRPEDVAVQTVFLVTPVVEAHQVGAQAAGAGGIGEEEIEVDHEHPSREDGGFRHAVVCSLRGYVGWGRGGPVASVDACGARDAGGGAHLGGWRWSASQARTVVMWVRVSPRVTGTVGHGWDAPFETTRAGCRRPPVWVSGRQHH